MNAVTRFSSGQRSRANVSVNELQRFAKTVESGLQGKPLELC